MPGGVCARACVEVVKRSDPGMFGVLSKRRVGERTIAWPSRCREGPGKANHDPGAPIPIAGDAFAFEPGVGAGGMLRFRWPDRDPASPARSDEVVGPDPTRIAVGCLNGQMPHRSGSRSPGRVGPIRQSKSRIDHVYA